jgi:hypothetical protein
MTRRILGTTGVMAIVAWFAASGCSEDSDTPLDRGCAELCSLGQAGDCTSITGDCDPFCAAVDRTKAPAGCESQSNAYEDCLNGDADVCAVDCDSEETAFSECMVAYCLMNASDADCVTLVASYG